MGQLVVCDPRYIESQWTKRAFQDIRIYRDVNTGKEFRSREHFENYNDPMEEYRG